MNKSREAIKAIHAMLPKTMVHTKTTAPDGKVVYEDDREVQESSIPLFEGLLHTETLAPILAARRNALDVAGVHVVDSETIVTEAIADLNVIEGQLTRAAKALGENKAGCRRRPRWPRPLSGVSISVSTRKTRRSWSPATHFGWRGGLWKRTTFAQAIVNLVSANGGLRIYREVASQNERQDVDSMLREVQELENQLRSEGTQAAGHAKDPIRAASSLRGGTRSMAGSVVDMPITSRNEVRIRPDRDRASPRGIAVRAESQSPRLDLEKARRRWMLMIVLAGNWWALALRGLLAVLFGITAFVMPGLTLAALVLLYGAYALVDGVFAVVASLAGRTFGTPWWAMLIRGLLGIAIGIVTFVWPGITELALLYIIAAWAVVTGGFEIAAAIRLRKEIQGEWLLVLSGALSVLFGLALMVYPAAGALAIVWLLGSYAIIFGVLLLVLGLRLRSLSQQVSRPSSPRRRLRVRSEMS